MIPDLVGALSDPVWIVLLEVSRVKTDVENKRGLCSRVYQIGMTFYGSHVISHLLEPASAFIYCHCMGRFFGAEHHAACNLPNIMSSEPIIDCVEKYMK